VLRLESRLDFWKVEFPNVSQILQQTKLKSSWKLTKCWASIGGLKSTFSLEPLSSTSSASSYSVPCA